MVMEMTINSSFGIQDRSLSFLHIHTYAQTQNEESGRLGRSRKTSKFALVSTPKITRQLLVHQPSVPERVN